MPKARQQIVTYAGYYANSTGNLNRNHEPEEEGPETEQPPGLRRWIPWSKLIARAWKVDPELCPKCGQQMKRTRPILERLELERLLKSIGRFGYPSRPPPAPLPEPEIGFEAHTSGGQGTATVVQLQFCDEMMALRERSAFNARQAGDDTSLAPFCPTGPVAKVSV